jgi:hypothetical protein
MDFMLDIFTPWNPADLSEQKRVRMGDACTVVQM